MINKFFIYLCHKEILILIRVKILEDNNLIQVIYPYNTNLKIINL